MADTTFVDGDLSQSNRIVAAWLNDVNNITYKGTLVQVLVGGGAGTKAVWTTATGTGAPVRAGSPTFTGTVGGVNSNWTGTLGAGGLVTFSGATSSVAAAAGTFSIRGGQLGFPATQVPSTDPNTLDDYKEATFTGTLTGATTAPTTTIAVTKVGNQVTLDCLAGVSATSNATTKTITGMPAAYFPTTAKQFPVRLSDNGGASVFGLIMVGTNGVLDFRISPDGAIWTASGTASISTWCIIYTLN